MSLTGWWHDSWAKGLDGFSFGFINALQLRGRSGAHDAETFQEYARHWSGVALEEFYAVPDCPELERLPEQGTFSFHSPLPTGCEENDRAHLDIWLGPKGWKSPAMFLLHGHMSVSDVGYRLWAKKLNQMGWTAVFFHLPYHYGRRPRGVLSGEMALSSNLIRTSEGIRQAVVELRAVSRLLRNRGCPHVGLWATSYGGWVAALLLSLESGISTAWLLEPIVDVDWAIWESPATMVLRRQLRSRGITREMIQGHVRKLCPRWQTPRLAPERILLLAGKFDRIATPETIRELNRKWAGSHYAELRQGHVGYQLMPESLRMARERFPELFGK
ncbi:MAG: hypothetical protein HC904_05440 [Blastochloris sp.]|nr:hypothetical protein [Blastochloris sp.]